VKSALPQFQKTRLKNGVRVLTERHPSARALSVGIWVETGTRDERAIDAGLSHFVEHMVFKRTRGRTAYQIARELEAVGGEINAYTTREYTCFYTHALADSLELSLDVLSDLVCRAELDATDVEKEKQVVLQEIQMAQDNLEDFIYDVFSERIYGANSMGWPILGSDKTVQNFSRRQVRDYYRRQYSAPRLIVAVAGNVEHDDVVQLTQKYLRPPAGRRRGAWRGKPRIKTVRDFISKPAEQTHILLGWPSVSVKSRTRFEAYIVSALLGGGMTSRLYQSVRERRGLVYSIYSQLAAYVDSGLLLIYAATDEKKAEAVVRTCLKEIERLRAVGIRKSDLELFRRQVTGQILLGSDDVENRMSSIGVNEMVFGDYRSIDDVVQDLERVSVDSVNAYLQRYLNPKDMSVLMMGAGRSKLMKSFLAELKS